MEENIKLVRVKKATWVELGKLKDWPERANFNDVIEWLLNERKIWREFYIREYMRHGFDREQSEQNCKEQRKMLDESEIGWGIFDD